MQNAGSARFARHKLLALDCYLRDLLGTEAVSLAVRMAIDHGEVDHHITKLPFVSADTSESEIYALEQFQTRNFARLGHTSRPSNRPGADFAPASLKKHRQVLAAVAFLQSAVTLLVRAGGSSERRHRRFTSVAGMA